MSRQFILTKKASINAGFGIVRKNELIPQENYNELTKRQKDFFEEYIEKAAPIDALKALEIELAAKEKRIAELEKTVAQLTKKQVSKPKEE